MSCHYPIKVHSNQFKALRNIYENFTEADAVKIKRIETVTNHDVKAVEYFLKEHFDNLNLISYKESNILD